jgi:xanthine/uracil permease
LPNSAKSQLKISEIILKGTIMGAIVTIPSIIAFLITWIVLDNLITAIIVGAIVHFIAMGFSLKISKTILIKK